MCLNIEPANIGYFSQCKTKQKNFLLHLEYIFIDKNEDFSVFTNFLQHRYKLEIAKFLFF